MLPVFTGQFDDSEYYNIIKHNLRLFIKLNI